MWSPPHPHTIIKTENNNIFKIKAERQEDSRSLTVAQIKMEKVNITATAVPGSSSSSSTAMNNMAARKIDPDRRSVSFTGSATSMDQKPSQQLCRRHSANPPTTPTSPPRSRSPIRKMPSLDTVKTGTPARVGIVVTDPKPLPQWIVDKEARKAKDRASASKKETQRRQRFQRDNTLGYEPRRYNRHQHQSERQAEYMAYASGGGGHGRD